MSKKTHPIDMHVGSMLRRLRCYAGMTQIDLARSVGITFQQLQKYELAINRVSASRLWDIAQELGAPVESFFPEARPGRSGPAWLDEPGFAQWVRIFRDTPEESRKSLLTVVKVIADKRL